MKKFKLVCLQCGSDQARIMVHVNDEKYERDFTDKDPEATLYCIPCDVEETLTWEDNS